MKKNLLFPLGLALCLLACTNNSNENKSENDADAARSFIRAALDGKFDIAKNYLLKDSSNLEYLDVARRSYERAPADTIKAYKASSILIYDASAINDSTTIVIYSNTFKNDKDTLKVVKINNQWLVDLKYLYEQGMDTVKPVTIKDTLR